jgi:Spy/CpxP family protein refolding chaperone
MTDHKRKLALAAATALAAAAAAAAATAATVQASGGPAGDGHVAASPTWNPNKWTEPPS